MQANYEAIRELGAEVVTVCQAKPEVLAMHLKAAPRPFPVVGDPDRKAYRAAGLEVGGWGIFLNWRALSRYLSLIFSGWIPRWPRSGEDVFQLGGDFVLDARQQIVLAHRSEDPGDRPSMATLLEAIRQATVG